MQTEMIIRCFVQRFTAASLDKFVSFQANYDKNIESMSSDFISQSLLVFHVSVKEDFEIKTEQKKKNFRTNIRKS